MKNSRTEEFGITGSTGWKRLSATALRVPVLLFWMTVASGARTPSPAQQAGSVGTASQTHWQQSQEVSGEKVSLTPRERQWLSQHDGLIRIGITVIPPQVLYEDGRYIGLCIDYIHIMERKLGCRFKLVPHSTWNEVVQAAQARRIDMIFAAQHTPERLKYLLFTAPYIELPNMIVVRKDRQGGADLKDMQGWRVATSQASAVHEYLERDFSYLDLLPVPDELSGLMKVSMGEADAMVVEISRASYYIEKAGILNLRVSGSAGLMYRLRFAVRSDWPVLSGILDKGLAAVTSEERQAINRRWIIVGEKSVFASRVLWFALATGLASIILVVSGVVIWNRALRRILWQQTSQLRDELAERRLAEAALRDSEEKYRRIVDTTNEGILVLGPDARITFANTRMTEMLGYSAAEMFERPLTDFMYAEDVHDHLSKLEARRKGLSDTYERRLQRKDGNIVWTQISATPIFVEAHGFQGSFGMFTDITSRKQAQGALIRLNRQLRAISTCNQVLMQAAEEQTLLDEICRIVCEEAGYRMTWVGYPQNDDARTVRPVAWAGFEEGYLAEAGITWADTERGRGPTGRAIREGVSTCIQDFATDPHAAPWREIALQRGYRSSAALPLKGESGTPFGALCIYSAHPGTFTLEEIKLLDELAGNLAFGITTLRIRAEHKKAELQILESEQLFRALVENSPDFIARYDRQFRRVYVNPAIQKLFEGQAQSVLGKTPADQSPLKAPQTYMDCIRQVIATTAECTAEMPFLTAKGEMHWGHMRFVPEFSANGKVVSVLAIGRDIHDIKENEQRFRMLAENFPDFVMRFDRGGHYTYVNPTVEKAFGMPAEAFIGKTLKDLPQHSKPGQNDALLTLIRQAFDRGVANQSEIYWDTQIGERIFEVRNAPEKDLAGNVVSMLSIARDITERKRNNAINEARMNLLQFAAIHSLSELLEETLNEAEKLTDSLIGFYHFVEDDQKTTALQNWSSRTKAEFCKTDVKQLHYPIAKAGVWVDCVHKGKPVIHNDYASLPHRKGMPPGHAEVIRELVVPVFRGSQIKAILGVGNKPTDYTGNDVEAMSLLADLAWEIAERKRADEKILRSDQRFRLHGEQSPLGFLEWDEKFRAVEWNAACERIFGYTKNEVIGRHAKDLILPVKVHELVDGIFHSLMRQTGGQHSINENVTKDGHIIICEWFNTTLIDKSGKAIGVASVCRDITEQKRMEEELARHREHLEEKVKERTAELEMARNKAQQYLDTAGVILIALDKNQKVTLINQKGCEMLQATSTDIIGKNWFETFVPERIRKDVLQGFRQLMAGEHEPAEHYENPVLTRGGRERLVAWHNVLLRDGEGQIQGTLSSGEDVTEQRHAETQIRNLNQDLEKRAVALEAANKELDAFAYSVSHDLRAPLRHIDGFLELLQKKAGTVLDQQSRYYMNTISEAAQKMGLLIDDLLSFSRMGRHTMSCQQVSLGRMVHEVIREFAPDTAGRTIAWRIGDLPVVIGDAAMLRIVLVNLISNALKFTRPRQEAQIEIGSLAGHDAEAVVFVRDNGVGFDMQYVDKLFGVFQRLHHSDEFEGTGIGLASVRRIIARHGGRTWAEGKPDRGAVFFFSLSQMG